MKRTGLLLVLLLWFSSCGDYLDIVPDNTVTLEDYFNRKEMAWEALAKVYSYMPYDPQTHNSSWLMGDEWVGSSFMDDVISQIEGIRIMRGLQNTTQPLLGLWSGTGGGSPLYKGIRNANIFLEYIGLVSDMSESEKKDWAAQVKFLKAYYHFLLLRQYGPIIIADKAVPLNAMSEDLFQRRSKVEDCFDYVIRLMNEAIPDLIERAATTDLGRIDRVGATAIKARVMFFRASPFWNGNDEYYKTFLDHDGQPFFPLEYNHEKWKDAIDAIDGAIALCSVNGLELYGFDGIPYLIDRDDLEGNPDVMQNLYDLRMSVVDPWNRELIWGQTFNHTQDHMLAHSCNMRQPSGYGAGYGGSAYAGQWLCASYRMLERYYTKNGLPPGEDMTFDSGDMYGIVSTPEVFEPEYVKLQGLMQPGVQTIKLYMNRELRFYASLGITGGYVRAHKKKITSMMYANSDGGKLNDNQTDYFCTGIAVQKLVHPESNAAGWDQIIRYPYPIIRMADLYLMKAEAMNEYLTAPNAEVYEAINKVRRRAGIPDVETVWSNATLVRPASLNKHLGQDGMREIILHERSVELAFEGSRFWDMHRHRMASQEFSSTIMGWNYEGYNARTFFILKPIQSRRFLLRDYLWPIQYDEINKNSNLIQNPGW
ncbi:MAG: RagB/SusD family nutrient uptake outer membrane protein [Prevotellaceae bacterium]|jgi:hypothetical protein|nr:RagB/SusD family nutrient uptake outer membrane protein [Prevotellaceae bacterium]